MKPRNLALSASFLLIACKPYERFVGEYNAGAVNPAAFPEAYLGEGGDPVSAGGVFTPLVAYVGGEPVSYYLFPAGSGQAKADNPRAVAAVPAPLAYTALPKSTTYTPVVAEVAVRTLGLPCQSIKTTDTVVTSRRVELDKKLPAIAGPDTKPIGIPDGRFLAWAIIDPSAKVQPIDPATGLGPQSYGWYQHFLVVYLDGGYIPTSADGSELVAQTLYVPAVVWGTDAAGAPALVPNSEPGSGLDLLEARRGDAGYSPFCRISLYQPPFPGVPMLNPDPSQTTATDRYVYCLQTR